MGLHMNKKLDEPSDDRCTGHMAPDISVCIANYNGNPYVRECLNSVFSQKGDFTLEVLLHDDHSTDGSLALVRNEFPEVMVIASDANVGFCVSNNRMVDRAHGRFILLLNNDAVLRTGALSRLLDYARDGHDGELLGLPQYTFENGGALLDRGYRTDLFLNPVPITQPGTHEATVATGACLWIPRDVWAKVGGFPPWFGSVAEDIYLCVAARLLGHSTTVLDTPGFDHWVGRNFGGGKVVAHRLVTTVRRRAYTERNKTFAMVLCYPGVVLWAILPLHLMFLLAESLFLGVTGAGFQHVRRIYGPVVPALWLRRRELVALRSTLMQRRRCTLASFFRGTMCLPHKLRMLVRYGRPELR